MISLSQWRQQFPPQFPPQFPLKRQRRLQDCSQGLSQGLFQGLSQISQSLCLGLSSGLLLGLAALPVQASSLEQGYDYLRRGWAGEAIATFQAVLARQPRSPEARLGLAQSYQKNGQDAEAWRAYQAVLEVEPRHREALRAIGTLGGYRSDWQQPGIEALTALLAQTPGDTTALAQRALLYGYQGRYTEAFADYGPLLAANPSPETMLGAAQVYTYSGQFEPALQWFERYRALGRPLNGWTTATYANALRGGGQPQKAIALLEPLVLGTQRNSSSPPPSPPADGSAQELRTALALAYASTGELPRARQLLSESSSPLTLARVVAQVGRDRQDPALLAEAADLYQTSLPTSPPASTALLQEIAAVWQEVPSRRPEALRLYEQLEQRLSSTTPSEALAIRWQRLALAQELGQLSGADWPSLLDGAIANPPTRLPERRALAQLLSRIEPAEPALIPLYEDLLATQPFLRFRLAQAQLQREDWEAARTNLVAYQATPEGQTNLGAELLLAQVERRSGAVDASVQRYQAILARNPDADTRFYALQGLAGLRFEQQNYPEATALYRELLALRPTDAETYRLLTEIALAQDHPSDALDHLRQARQVGATSEPLHQRSRRLQRQFLRRRGFQPGWERY